MSLHTKNLLKALSLETVKDMVKNELQTYDADKTGRTDYALESSGLQYLTLYFAFSKNFCEFNFNFSIIK